MKRLALPLVGLLLVVACSGPSKDKVLDLATTTSVRDSGLLDELLPIFEKRTGLDVRVIAVGSGAALRMGADGDADVLLTHAPPGEKELVDQGKLLDHTPFMRNWFVLAGPKEDPAGVRDAPNAVEALRRIAAADAPFVSRNDDSGTNRREKALLKKAGLDPSATWSAVKRTNAGMGHSLEVAGESRAYILADVGTFTAFQKSTNLVSLSNRDDPDLANIYSVSRPTPAGRDLNVDGAKKFIAFFTSPEIQRKIAAYKGGGLFIPLLLDKGGS